MAFDLTTRGRAAGAGSAAFLIAVVVLSWDLTRPALWLDEGATIAATNRTWPHLWVLEHGPDAPLVPFYAVIKVLAGASRAVAPALAGHPELLYRWPSMVAMAAACGLLVAWVARYGRLRLALASGVAMLLTAGVSRYAQEARAYAFTVLLAVIATWLWTLVIRRPSRWWWFAGYVVAVAALVMMQTLAATLLVAHLVAALLIPRSDPRETTDRWTPLLRTTAGVVLGLLIAAPQAMVAMQNGAGAKAFQTFTPKHVLEELLTLYAAGAGGILIWQASVVLLLAVAGIARLRWAAGQFVLRTVAAWAIVPPVLWVLGVALRPNLLLGRYMLFTVPAWSVLIGLGAVTVLEAVARRVVRWRPATARPAVILVAVALLGGLIAAELPPLASVRTAAGHGEDVRPAMAMINEEPYRDLPIVMAAGLTATELEAYDRSAIPRVINLDDQYRLPVIWPVMRSGPARRQALYRVPAFIDLVRNASGSMCASPGQIVRSRRTMTCLGLAWAWRSYRVAVARKAGRRWSFLVLVPYAGRAKPIAGSQL